jgi:hypothetical protein
MATAEMVTDGHPDKFCDQVADAILDEALRQDSKTKAGIEGLAKDNLLIVLSEMSTRANLIIDEINRRLRALWTRRFPVGERPFRLRKRCGLYLPIILKEKTLCVTIRL